MEFLEKETKSTGRPSGSLNQACSAISQAHKAARLPDSVNSDLLHVFRQGVVNVHT